MLERASAIAQPVLEVGACPLASPDAVRVAELGVQDLRLVDGRERLGGRLRVLQVQDRPREREAVERIREAGVIVEGAPRVDLLVIPAARSRRVGLPVGDPGGRGEGIGARLRMVDG